MDQDKEGKRVFEYNYTVDQATFTSQTHLTSPLNRILLLVASFFLITALLYVYLEASAPTRFDSISQNTQLVLSLVVGVLVTTGAVLGGFLWKFVSSRIARATYQVYLDEPRTTFQRIFQSLYFKFAEQDNQIYLEARGKDLRLVGLKNRIGLILGISIPQLSFFILAISFFTRPAIEYLKDFWQDVNPLVSFDLELQVAGAVFMAIILLTLYFPATILMDSSNIRTWNTTEEKSGIPLKRIRNYIDGIAGLGAVIAGRDFYETTLGQEGFVITSNIWFLSQDGLFLSVVDYSFWLLFILLVSWPFIIPTVIVYFHNQEQQVNNFRMQAIKEGIPISVTNLRILTADEQQAIAKLVNPFSD